MHFKSQETTYKCVFIPVSNQSNNVIDITYEYTLENLESKSIQSESQIQNNM